MNKFIALGFGAALALTAAADANALTLTLTQGANTVTLSDNGVGDANGATDAITFIGSIGTYQFNVATVFSDSAAADPIMMDLNAVVTGTGLLVIEATDSYSDPAILTSLIQEIGGTIGNGGTLTYDVLVNGVLVNTLSFLTDGAFSGSGFADNSDAAAPYDITLRVTIDHSRLATSSFDGTVEVPEPATLALFGAGLLGLGMIRRRKA